MFGPGFTWLIKRNPSQQLSILNTYLAGSPFPGAHYRRQPLDAATSPSGSIPGSQPAWKAVLQLPSKDSNAHAGKFGSFAEHGQLAPGGVELEPLMCVNTWQHCWLMNWGIAGKRGYLEAWWDSIDWGVVERNAGWGGDAKKLPEIPRRGRVGGAYYVDENQ